MNQYYMVDANGQQSGPHPGENLRYLGATADTYVWCEGMGGEWKKAGDVAELAPLFASASNQTRPVSRGADNYQQHNVNPQPNAGFGQAQPVQQQPVQYQQPVQQPVQQQPVQQNPQYNQGFGAQQQPQPIQINVHTNPGAAPHPVPPGKPDSWMWLSICTTLLCCLISGIVACVYSSKVDSQWVSGDYEGAIKSSKAALTWNIVGIVAPIVGGILYFVFLLFFAALL